MFNNKHKKELKKWFYIHKNIFKKMFPLPRSKIVYGETTIGVLLDKFILPNFQRVQNESHMMDIYHSIKKYYETYKDIVFTGAISVGVYAKKKEFMVFDGQHRIHALQRLRSEYPIDDITIRMDTYRVKHEQDMFQLYNIINQNKPVQLFRGLEESTCAPRFEAWFRAKFNDYWKDTNRPTLLNVNGADMMKRMNESGMFSKTSECLIEECERLLLFYSVQTEETWEKWGITMNTKYKTLVSKHGFWFGLYRNYEWISRLFEHTDDHSLTEMIRKRTSLSPNKRDDVWNKRFDGMQGECYCCKEDINYQKGYHCGHIEAVANGGSNDLSNLEVVCQRCNYDMGTMNMLDYKKKFY